jgi:hypothetical protein
MHPVGHEAPRTIIFPVYQEDALTFLKEADGIEMRFLDADNDEQLSQAIALSVQNGALNPQFNPNKPEDFRKMPGNDKIIGHFAVSATNSEYRKYRGRVAEALKRQHEDGGLDEAGLSGAAERDIIPKDRLIQLLYDARKAMRQRELARKG